MIDFIHTAQAAVSLPTIPATQDLGGFIVSIYNYAIAIVGLAVFVQFVRAGFTYLLAGGNVAEVGSAKTHMQNAILGALLLLSSYLILNVINPDLLNMKLFDLKEIGRQIKEGKFASENAVGVDPNTYSVPQTPTVTTSMVPESNAVVALQQNGISIFGTSVDGISRYAVTDLTGISQKCGYDCGMAITQFNAFQDAQWVTVRGNEDMSEAIKSSYTKINNSRYAAPDGTYYQNTGGNTWEIRYPVGTPL